MNEPLAGLELPGFEKHQSGKVREVFNVGENMLIVATDRISAFDRVLPTLIPLKGRILNELSAFWFGKTGRIVANHFISSDIDTYPLPVKKYRDILAGRSMLVRKAEPFKVECVVRGYVAGSAWQEYSSSGTVAGTKYRDLKQCDRFGEPLFTPATKAEAGHDENITFDRMADIVGIENARTLKAKSLELYAFAHGYALGRGIIIADTKFEFGLTGEGIILIDELLTPDSSRFWEADQYQPGQDQPSFDKQFVRNYLRGVNWDRNSDPPALPREIVERTVERYREAYRRLTGKEV